MSNFYRLNIYTKYLIVSVYIFRLILIFSDITTIVSHYNATKMFKYS